MQETPKSTTGMAQSALALDAVRSHKAHCTPAPTSTYLLRMACSAACAAPMTSATFLTSSFISLVASSRVLADFSWPRPPRLASLSACRDGHVWICSCPCFSTCSHVKSSFTRCVQLSLAMALTVCSALDWPSAEALMMTSAIVQPSKAQPSTPHPCLCPYTRGPVNQLHPWPAHQVTSAVVPCSACSPCTCEAGH